MPRLDIRAIPYVATILILLAAVFPATAIAQIHDKKIFSSTNLEAGWDMLNAPTSMRWEGNGWIGTDKHKLRWNTAGEVHKSLVEEAEIQLLYSRRISKFFDAQVGVRYDFKPIGTTYAVLGVEGLAPYWFEVGANLFIDHKGNVSARLEAEYDLLITQRLILKPFMELNFSANEVGRRSIGPGLTDIETGLQLRYEIKREFAPYVEFRYSRLVGRTSRLAQLEAEKNQSFSLLLGIKISF
jgi:copper resistance protein B